MKHSYVVFKIDSDGSIVPHDHPVFSGDVAYDLGQEQEVQVCDELNVREFNGTNEVIAAVHDYNREHAKQDDYTPVGSFFVMERYTFGNLATASKSKKKVVSKSKGK
jgi:hypothetical protein